MRQKFSVINTNFIHASKEKSPPNWRNTKKKKKEVLILL